jgi:hypothetical protein
MEGHRMHELSYIHNKHKLTIMTNYLLYNLDIFCTKFVKYKIQFGNPPSGLKKSTKFYWHVTSDQTICRLPQTEGINI